MEGRTLDNATFAVVDVETTGIDPLVDRVVEVACVVMRRGREVQAFRSFVDPGCEIGPRASAVHGLTNAHVAGAPALGALAPTLRTMCDDAIVVAHNATFDRAFLPLLTDRPWLCTLRLARHCFPELDGHANQVLRYALAIPQINDSGAHRALDDVRVTAGVLSALLRRYRERGGDDCTTALFAYASGPILAERLPFGPHRGTALNRIPEHYLRSLCAPGRLSDRDLRYSIAAELRRRQRERIGNSDRAKVSS